MEGKTLWYVGPTGVGTIAGLPSRKKSQFNGAETEAPVEIAWRKRYGEGSTRARIAYGVEQVQE